MTDFLPPPDFNWREFHQAVLRAYAEHTQIRTVFYGEAHTHHVSQVLATVDREEYRQQMALRFILGSDYARLTKRPLKLDDISMLLLERIVEIEDSRMPEPRSFIGEEIETGQIIDVMTAATTRRFLRLSLSHHVVYLFRHPDIFVRRHMKGHLTLDTGLTLLLSVVPLLSTPRPGVADAHFAEALVGYYRRMTNQPKPLSV